MKLTLLDVMRKGLLSGMYSETQVLACSIMIEFALTFSLTATNLPGTQVTNKRCVDIDGRHFTCTLTERDWESSRLRESQTSVCTLGHYYQGSSEPEL